MTGLWMHSALNSELNASATPTRKASAAASPSRARPPKEASQKADEIRARLKKELPARDTRRLVDQFAETWITTTLANSDRKASTKSMQATVARHHIVGSNLGATPMHPPSH